jgi:hypothetical protein
MIPFLFNFAEDKLSKYADLLALSLNLTSIRTADSAEMGKTQSTTNKTSLLKTLLIDKIIPPLL